MLHLKDEPPLAILMCQPVVEPNLSITTGELEILVGLTQAAKVMTAGSILVAWDTWTSSLTPSKLPALPNKPPAVVAPLTAVPLLLLPEESTTSPEIPLQLASSIFQ